MRKIGLGLTLVVIASSASADEQMQTLAISGNWVAMAHTASMTAAPDLCLVIHASAGVGFRYGDAGLEFRVTNESWTLPPSVKGNVGLSVGSISQTYEIVDNTDHMVTILVPATDAPPLFGAMDKGQNLAVTVGKSKPFNVSLAGSTRATNAFRTCAHIGGAAQAPGGNPFQ